MAEVAYGGISDTDGFEMRRFLASYCANRVGKPPAPSDPRRPLPLDELSLLTGYCESGFIRDVLRMVSPAPKLVSGDILASLFQAKPAGGI